MPGSFGFTDSPGPPRPPSASRSAACTFHVKLTRRASCGNTKDGFGRSVVGAGLAFGRRGRDGSGGTSYLLSCRVERRHPAQHAPFATRCLRPFLDAPVTKQPVTEATAHFSENAV